MPKRIFDHDVDCAFCGNKVPEGCSTCSKCGATYESRYIGAIAFPFVFILIALIFIENYWIFWFSYFLGFLFSIVSATPHWYRDNKIKPLKNTGIFENLSRGDKIFVSTGVFFILAGAGFILSKVVPHVGFLVGLFLILVPVIAIAKPLPKLYLGHRLFSACIVLFVGLPTAFWAIDTFRLANLRATDPTAYLEEIESTDPPLWFSELEELDPERYKAEVAARTAEAAARTAEAAENRRKGFHCLSGWDGSHRMFLSDVKSRMRDPDSFEHVETRISPISDGRHTIFMTYRAKNGFGGYSGGIAIGSYSNATCQHIITSLE